MYFKLTSLYLQNQYSSYAQCAGRAVEEAEIGILMARRAVKSLGDKPILSQHAVVKKAKA